MRELGYLDDEDVINLSKTICHPGGHLPNPAFVVGGPGNATIPYTSIMVSQSAETNMQLASYTVSSSRHHNRISRAAKVGTMNPTSIRRLCNLKIKEDKRDGNPPLAPTIDAKNWPKTIGATYKITSVACLGRDKGTVGLCH